MRAVALTFPPLVKGGAGGVGRTTSASSVWSPFARKDVRKRHVLQAGEAAHARSTLSIDRATAASIVDSAFTGPPPVAPPFARGKEDRGSDQGRATKPAPLLGDVNPKFSPRQGQRRWAEPTLRRPISEHRAPGRARWNFAEVVHGASCTTDAKVAFHDRGDPCRGVAIAIRARASGHRLVRDRVGKKLGCGRHDHLDILTDQAGDAGLDRLGTLAFISHHQDRPAQGGCFLLNAA